VRRRQMLVFRLCSRAIPSWISSSHY
jgi:hypothetical protein